MQDEIQKIAEKCTHLDANITNSDLIHLRPYIESFLDSDWLHTKLQEYQAWASKDSDPVLQRRLLHRPLGMNLLVAMIWAARSWENEYSNDPGFPPQLGIARLANLACATAVLELHASDYLDQEARQHIRERFQAADNVMGMIHEITTYAYLLRKGARVEPRFLKRSSRQEIIAHWKDYIIPVQCKSKQPGSGRIISRDAFITLAGAIARDAKVSKRSLLVRIGTTGSIRQKDIAFIRHKIATGVGSDIAPTLISNDGRVFSLKVQSLSGHFTAESVEKYLSSFQFHIGMVIGDPSLNGIGYKVDVVVGIDANPDDALRSFRSLRESIKEGANQLKEGPPGIVAIHYADPITDFEGLSPS